MELIVHKFTDATGQFCFFVFDGFAECVCVCVGCLKQRTIATRKNRKPNGCK